MASVGGLQQLFVAATVGIVGTSLLAAAYVAVDDIQRGDSSGGLLWVVVLFPLLPFVVVGTYLSGRVTDGAGPLGPRRRVALTAVIAGLVALGVGAILAPPDPFSQARYVTSAYPLGVLVGYMTTV